MRRAAAWMIVALVPTSCLEAPIDVEGQFGRRIPLATGDTSPLPRLVFLDEGCPGSEGGCPSLGGDGCAPVLLDSLVPISALKARDAGQDGSRLDVECLEIRSARGMAAPDPTEQDLARAVARFRFGELPLVRGPQAGTDEWNWTAGDHDGAVELGGVLGGNLMRNFAIELRDAPGETPSLTLFTAFPGDEGTLAEQGRAFLPVQFPGRLLGRGLNDQCDIGGDNCEIKAFDLDPDRNVLALESTRMVMDACFAPPPCHVAYTPNPDDPNVPGTCARSTGGAEPSKCDEPTDADAGGRSASLVVATGVPGLVLFEDSATRMLGPLDDLPTCDAPMPGARACVEGSDGVLHLAGWPDAGIDTPLRRLRVRSLALLPGLTRSKGDVPCERLRERLKGLERQCEAFVDDFEAQGNLGDTSPPYSGNTSSTRSDNSVAAVGEVYLLDEQTDPDATRWLPTLVVEPTHPMVLALRRDVSPEALEPDGLIGTALLPNAEVILDYTDLNPGLRMKCLDPRAGGCFVAPDCADDGDAACCFGLPLNLLVDFIQRGGSDTCCIALSADELLDVQAGGELCQGYDPP